MQQLIERAAACDRAALAELWQESRGLIRRIANGYKTICQYDAAIDTEDLEQVGYFALLNACRTYSPENGGSWGNWLVYYLRREMNTALGRRDGRYTRPDHNAASLDTPAFPDDPDSMTVGECIPDETLPESGEELIADEIVLCVRAAVQRLPDERQRYVITETALHGKTYREVGEKLGISVETVRKAINRGERALKEDPQLSALRSAHCIAPLSYWQHKGVSKFHADWTSTTEEIVLRLMAGKGAFCRVGRNADR